MASGSSSAAARAAAVKSKAHAATAATQPQPQDAENNNHPVQPQLSPHAPLPYKNLDIVLHSVLVALLLHALHQCCIAAYRIRMHAINQFGRVIHEFDPYFNYRATEYLWEHGWRKFRTWFDYKVWYPLGRPVGTTIYPGMQVTSVLIKSSLLPDWTINDICCFVPVWFGVAATLAVAWLTYNCVSNAEAYSIVLQDIPLLNRLYQKLLKRAFQQGLVKNGLIRYTGSDWGLHGRHPLTPLCCAVWAAWIMSIVPAHLLRSVGGGYDNESVAMTAMVLTFCCWTKSLHTYGTTSNNWTWNIVWGVATGVAYFNMVAAWGGYVFVINLIGLHAAFLVGIGRYSLKLYWAYSVFFVVGTCLAIQVPVVGWNPLKSLEQLGPAAVFVGLQLIRLSDYFIQQRQQQLQQLQQPQHSRKLKTKPLQLKWIDRWKIRVSVFAAALVVVMVIVMILAPTGYFGPISSRVRGLFVEHTKTGNPLVDSVAEHQPASKEAYFQYLNSAVYIAPLGLGLVLLRGWSDASSFLLVYALTAYFFSHRMVRLVLLTAPIASVCSGIFLGHAFGWAIGSITTYRINVFQELFVSSSGSCGNGSSTTDTNNNNNNNSNPRALIADPWWVRILRLLLSLFAINECVPAYTNFSQVAHRMAEQISHPSIILKGRTNDGKVVTIDDYREAYWWLRDHTDEDARVMAWWDYGYQITGISNRTTIADGNTWNHEHIAFLGRTLTSPEKEAHRVARHLADYVLVWAGGGGDDLAKSPHLRRIANSVFRGLCHEPTCSDFGFYSDRSPTPAMKESLLYKLVINGLNADVAIDPNRFKEVFRSKYAKVRIYKIMAVSQQSKDWVADPRNRVCDAPGSWFCRGQYPPALEKILKEKRDFKQLEDFNAKREDDSEYQKQYLENLMKPGPRIYRDELQDNVNNNKKKKSQKPSEDEIEEMNDPDMWSNSVSSTELWNLISNGNMEGLQSLLKESPILAHIRSQDGRGPMWWAHEYGRSDMVEFLKSQGVRETLKDQNGITPLDIRKA